MLSPADADFSVRSAFVHTSGPLVRNCHQHGHPPRLQQRAAAPAHLRQSAPDAQGPASASRRSAAPGAPAESLLVPYTAPRPLPPPFKRARSDMQSSRWTTHSKHALAPRIRSRSPPDRASPSLCSTRPASSCTRTLRSPDLYVPSSPTACSQQPQSSGLRMYMSRKQWSIVAIISVLLPNVASTADSGTGSTPSSSKFSHCPCDLAKAT